MDVSRLVSELSEVPRYRLLVRTFWPDGDEERTVVESNYAFPDLETPTQELKSLLNYRFEELAEKKGTFIGDIEDVLEGAVVAHVQVTFDQDVADSREEPAPSPEDAEGSGD